MPTTGMIPTTMPALIKICQKVNENPRREVAAEPIFGPRTVSKKYSIKETEQRHERDAADKPHSSPEHGDGKVGMLFREKAQLALRALKEPFPHICPEPMAILTG